MFRVDAGLSGKYCDGLDRRSFVQLGVAGMASLGLGDILRAKTASAANGTPKKETSAILLWLDGGPSHLDLYDLKPKAPQEYRGFWNPIPTNVPGMEISELFPLQAQVADKFSIVRSLHHDTGDHFAGGHRMLTTKDMGVSGVLSAGRFPGIGSIIARERGARQPGMPAYVAVPYGMSIGLRPGYFGGNFLGVEYDPFETGGDPNASNFKVENLKLASGLSVNRLEDRRSLMKHFDRIRKDADQTGVFTAMDRFDQDAFSFVTGERARRAFDITMEDPRIRDQYGRNSWGQSTLLARRLVEAGSTFATVHFGGWDHHWDLKTGMERYLPMVDMAVSALFNDLDQRGLLDSTLVILCGEFSRTPRINDGGNGGPPLSMGQPGRDHWGNVFSFVLAGAGIRPGQVYGASDRDGAYPAQDRVTPPELTATILHLLGIHHEATFPDRTGRPMRVVEGEPITALM